MAFLRDQGSFDVELFRKTDRTIPMEETQMVKQGWGGGLALREGDGMKPELHLRNNWQVSSLGMQFICEYLARVFWNSVKTQTGDMYSLGRVIKEGWGSRYNPSRLLFETALKGCQQSAVKMNLSQ